MNKYIKRVTFFGSASLTEENRVWQEAYNAASFLAQNGYEIVDGGGPGIMRAATQGARSAGGRVLGITLYPEDMKNFEGRDKENILFKEIKAKNYLKRTFGLLEHGDCFVVFKGGSGTISEFGMCWALAKLYYGHHKPIFLYGSFWEKIISAFKKTMEIDNQELESLMIVDSPEGILWAIKRWEKKMQKVKHDGHLSGKYSL